MPILILNVIKKILILNDLFIRILNEFDGYLINIIHEYSLRHFNGHPLNYIFFGATIAENIIACVHPKLIIIACDTYFIHLSVGVQYKLVGLTNNLAVLI